MRVLFQLSTRTAHEARCSGNCPFWGKVGGREGCFPPPPPQHKQPMPFEGLFSESYIGTMSPTLER